MKKSVFEKFKNDFTLTGAILDVDGKVKKTGEIRYITTNRNIHPYEQSLIDLLSNLENANK